MAPPPELRALCYQLSTTSPADLPLLVPSLQHLILQCHAPLAAAAAQSKDASETAVLVHKLKTQITTLVQGKSAEGRFAAAALIKSLIDMGGWEMLRGAGPWVRAMIAILSKPDAASAKQMCILTLTSIYLETHRYQTLVREMTTPTLPSFVQACLKLISSKASGRPLAIPQALLEAILESFAALIPRHHTLFRPFAAQVRQAIKPYLAPTRSDARFVADAVQRSAQRVAVAVHTTAAKNNGVEEWSKAVKETVKGIHQTADQVFRAVVEDWESDVGYKPEAVDVDQPLGSTGDMDLPTWAGVESGIERMIGLLRLLGAHFQYQTPGAVAIPLSALMDMVARIMSLEPPDEKAASRIRPGIEKHEREGLSAGLPALHTATVRLLTTLVKRLQHCFLPLAQQSLDLIFWLFTSSATKQTETFRVESYQLVIELLRIHGPMVSRTQVRAFKALIQSTCADLVPAPLESQSTAPGSKPGPKKGSSGSAVNADSFLQQSLNASSTRKRSSELTDAAAEVLPLYYSHLVQQHLDISTRSLMDRTAILTHNKDAMLASILNPFVGKNNRALASIVPHLARAFPGDLTVECLLRPRFPPLPMPSSGAEVHPEDDMPVEIDDEPTSHDVKPDLFAPGSTAKFQEPAASRQVVESAFASVEPSVTSIFSTSTTQGPETGHEADAMDLEPRPDTPTKEQPRAPLGESKPDDSDDESVHLNMELSESEDEDMDE